MFVASIHFCGVSISPMAAVKLKACSDADPSENEELRCSSERSTLALAHHPLELIHHGLPEERNYPNTQCRGPAAEH